MSDFHSSANVLEKAGHTLAIIPVGSIEQHGPHLPVSTDWTIAGALGQAVEQRMGGFLLPALPISLCKEQLGKRGSVSMEAVTFDAMIKEMILCLKEQGFSKVLLLQCHGGVFILTHTVRDLNTSYGPDLQVARVDICELFNPLHQQGIAETNSELHAGEIETSLMLHLAPKDVHMELAVDCVPRLPRSYLGYGGMYRASPSGVWGEPTRASASKGRRILDSMADMAVQQAKDAFAYMSRPEP